MTFVKNGDWLRVTAIICTALLIPGEIPLAAEQAAQAPAAQGANQAPPPKLKTADELDSLVAPIALYPDPLLAQVLAASTYPLEIVQCQRWLTANSKLKGEELTKAAAKQPWDASVQALVAFPDALKRLDENIQWTTDLGNAFLDQQGDVMDACQRMRKKAKDGGKLQSSKEQKVEVKTVEQKTVIEIQPSSPEVIYVPSYNPTVVYGPPVVAYPPVYYPPPPPPGAYVATAAISFGVGVMMGAMWSGCCHGGYGWGCGWGGGNNNITINNNFNNRYGYNNINNIQGGNRVNNVGSGNRGGNSNWQHNSSHRGAVPYNNARTAQKYGGSARDSAGNTQRFNQSGQPRASANDRGAGAGNRGAGGGDRGGAGAGNRAQASDRSAGRGQSGGADRMGNRSISGDSGRQSAFSGAESRSRTEAASNRGFSSSRDSGSRASSSRSSGGGGGGRSGGGGGRSGGGRRR